MEFRGHLRVVMKALVLQRVLDDEHIAPEDDVCAERDAAVAFSAADALRRLEPLAVLVQQADRADGRAEVARGNGGHSVEAHLVVRVEIVQAAKRVQALSFMSGEWCADHSCLVGTPKGGKVRVLP